MGGGGKGGSTTVNKTEIPPEVLARYNSVNARAEKVAEQPYQKYSNDPNAFVAPLSQTQQAGIQNTNAMAGAAQPYYQQATGLAQASAYNVNPNDLNVNQYMNPFTQNVVNATQAAMNQQQGQQLAQQQTDAIKGGAFGGDRAGLQRGILQGQQSLAQSQAIAPLYQQNYNQALAAAQQQQGVNLGAQQANRANLQGVSQSLANLGTNAQQAGLAGSQAQLAAGQVQQQTEQAGKQAMYNQFMQEQGYPFQVAQFLANIATGTGALSGNQSTSTTTGGGGFFSDKRLKENVQKVGETNDGQPIYRYNYKGDPRTQIGLMAQDVEKHHPEAVGLAGGYKTVDYKKATKDAVHKSGGGATDAYSMTDSPSSMLAGQGAGLAPISLPAMRVGADIPVSAGASGSEIAALRAPKATGLSLGTMEGRRAEADSLRSAISSGRGTDLGAGPEYLQSRLSELDKFLAQNSSQGGLVGPEGGSFSRGGYAFGGGPYGVQLEPMQARQMMQAQPGQRPAERNALKEAKDFADFGGLLYSGYKNRPDFLRSDADVEARKQTEAVSKIRELKDLDWARKNDIDVDALLGKAHGGLIGDRDGFNTRGYVNSSSNPYSGITEGPLDDTLQTQQQTPRPSLDVKGAPKPPPAKSGLGELTQMASLGKSGKNAFDWASKQLTGEASPTAMSSTIAEAAPGAATATEASTGALGAATAPTGGVIDLTTAAAPGLAGAVEGAGAATSLAAPAIEGAAAAAPVAEGLFGGLTAAAAPVIEGVTAMAAPVMAGLEALGPLALLFSDERMKHDIKKVGTLFDGQPVYRYAYNGDDKTQMGLLAQKVEKIHPDAVGLAGGMKMVDYEKATDKAAKRGHYQGQGFVYPEILDKDVGEEDYVPSPPKPEERIPLPAVIPAEPPVRGDRATTPPPGLGAAPTPPAVRVGDNGLTVVPPGGIPDNKGNAMPAPRPAKPVERRTSAPEPTFPSLGGLVPTGARETLSSENFWVPALSGIGAMLASPNKTLLGAVGSGLVGGTSAYTGLQKQQSEIAKNSLDIFNKIFEKREDGDGNISYMNLQTGQPATPQEAFGFLKGMPGFSGLAKAPAASIREAPQRDATVALAGDVVDKGVELVTPRIAASPAGGAARTVANAPAETTVATPGTPAPGAPPARPAGAAPVAKPEEGDQAEIRIPEDAQAAILKADAWARSQPDVKAHLDEARTQSRIADQRQAQMRQPISPEKRAALAKEFEIANTQAREATSRAEATVKNLTAPILADIGRQLGVSTKAVEGAARLKREEALAVLDPEVVRRQAEAAALKTRSEETEKALIGEATTVLTDPDTGVKYKLPLDPTTRKPVAAPPAQPPMNGAPAPKKAEIEPLTRAVIAGRPTPPKGGGMPIHANLPGNAMIVGDLDDKSRELIKEDAKFYGDMLNKSEALTVGSQRYNTITNAFKLFQSGPGAVPLSEYAAIAKSWGAPDIAKALFDGDPDAVQVLQKEAPGLVLEQLKAATPRFAVNEFNALLDKAVPEGGRLPEANFQMVAQGLAIMNRSHAFLDSWADAQADGWRSMSAYYLEWGKANPMPAYLESAKLQMGNFAGMPIPPKDKLAVGATYVTPKELDGETKAAMGGLGIQPGDIWRYNGRDKKPTVIPRADMFSVYMGY